MQPAAAYGIIMVGLPGFPAYLRMNAFAVLIGLGASLGVACLALQSDRPRERQRLMDAGLIVLLGALLGGRFFFVAANRDYFAAHLIEAAQMWLGGFSGAGALAGGLAALLPASALSGSPPAKLSDRLLPMLPPLAVSAWLACWQAGSAYGPLAGFAGSGPAWWAFPARDEWGVVAYRFPTQLLAAVMTLALFAALEPLKPRLSASGQAGSAGFLVVALVTFAASFLRADPARSWMGWRLDGWAALGLLLSAGVLCAAAFFPLGPALRAMKSRQAHGT